MAFLLSLYLVLHLCTGLALPLRRGFKPYFYSLMETVGADMERRLNRESRLQSVRFIRGMVVGVVLGIAGALAGYVVARVGQMPYGWSIELVFLSLCINFMTPMKLVRRIARHLADNELKAAADALQPYLKEPLANADSHAIIRKAIEFIGVSLNAFLLAPGFWFLAAGPVGMSVYVTYAALRQAFGPPDARHDYFGRFSRIVHMLMNAVPLFLTTALLCLAALFVSRSSPLRAAATVFGQVRQPYQDWTSAALAGGLGVTLGGPVRYSPDYAEERGWTGPEGSTARLQIVDLSRAALLQYVVCLACLGIVSGILVWGT